MLLFHKGLFALIFVIKIKRWKKIVQHTVSTEIKLCNSKCHCCGHEADTVVYLVI